MPRPRRCRHVGGPPNFTYFKPAGIRIVDLDESILAVDEFEAIRLKDLENLNQQECSQKMGVSQPTFHRLLTAARKKIADAIIHGKAIRIDGGNYIITSQQTRPGAKQHRRYGRGAPGECRCPNCGHRETKQLGEPCYTRMCSKCGSPMIRS
jgi:predicted DNA-binding protein (UPF0251 family)